MAVGGLVILLILFYPAWSPRCRRLRKRARDGLQVFPETPVDLVARADAVQAEMETWGVGPEWEQDRPFPEIWGDDEA